MSTTKLNQNKSRKWFRARRRRHNPMLVPSARDTPPAARHCCDGRSEQNPGFDGARFAQRQFYGWFIELKAVVDLPIEVPFHSIIGQRKAGAVENGQRRRGCLHKLTP